MKISKFRASLYEEGNQDSSFMHCQPQCISRSYYLTFKPFFLLALFSIIVFSVLTFYLVFPKTSIFHSTQEFHSLDCYKNEYFVTSLDCLKSSRQCEESNCLILQMYCVIAATPREYDYCLISSCVPYNLRASFKCKGFFCCCCLPKDNVIESFCLKEDVGGLLRIYGVNNFITQNQIL